MALFLKNLWDKKFNFLGNPSLFDAAICVGDRPLLPRRQRDLRRHAQLLRAHHHVLLLLRLLPRPRVPKVPLVEEVFDLLPAEHLRHQLRQGLRQHGGHGRVRVPVADGPGQRLDVHAHVRHVRRVLHPGLRQQARQGQEGQIKRDYLMSICIIMLCYAYDAGMSVYDQSYFLIGFS